MAEAGPVHHRTGSVATAPGADDDGAGAAAAADADGDPTADLADATTVTTTGAKHLTRTWASWAGSVVKSFVFFTAATGGLGSLIATVARGVHDRFGVTQLPYIGSGVPIAVGLGVGCSAAVVAGILLRPRVDHERGGRRIGEVAVGGYRWTGVVPDGGDGILGRDDPRRLRR